METVFLHGLGQTAADWLDIVKESGLSHTDCPELFTLTKGPVTYEALLRGLEERLGKKEGPVRLCGLSLGAILALDYGLRHPERTASLVLIGAQYKVPTRMIDFQNILFRCMPERAFHDWGLPKEDAIRLCRSMRSLDFSGKLHKLTCPAAILCGEKDRANRKAARELHEAISRSTLRILPHTGHVLTREAVEVLSALLREEE